VPCIHVLGHPVKQLLVLLRWGMALNADIYTLIEQIFIESGWCVQPFIVI
jgi:hypothetical protein